MIRHIHLDECDSTQDVLKEQLSSSSSEALVVSCENQTSGRGRGENKWSCLPGSLCFSLNLPPHPVISFTAIEMAVILTDFFQEKSVDLKLKWPNDLWTEDLRKCGGILVQGTQKQYLVGIGLNIYSNDAKFGGIYAHQFDFSKKEFALEISEFLHSHRIISAEEIKFKWLKRCGHLHKRVCITEDHTALEGEFIGLGDYGEAIIRGPEGNKNIFNGSLGLA